MGDYQFHWLVVYHALPQMLKGAWATLHVSLVSMLLGIIIAVFLALGKMSEFKILKIIPNIWIETARNTPVLFQIYMAYFGLGAFHIHLSPYVAVLGALVFFNAGYLAETFRGGFQSIPPTQLIAARSMGMTKTKAYRYVVLPQMFRRVYHPMTNQFVWSILLSSLGILVGMNDLAGETQRLQSLSYRTLEFFIVAGAIYYVMTKTVLFVSGRISRKIFTGDIS